MPDHEPRPRPTSIAPSDVTGMFFRSERPGGS